MFDFTGTRFDFTVAEGVPDRIALRFSMNGTAGQVNLAGATWQFRAMDAGTGQKVEGATVEHGENLGELVLYLPAVKAGTYSYELFATDATGDINRVIYGVCTAITSEHAAGLIQKSYKEVARTMDVVVPVVHGAKLELRWVSCSAAEVAAATAHNAIGTAQQEADRAKQEADRAAQAAEQAADAADGVREEVDGLITRASQAVNKVESMEGRLDAIDNHIRDSIIPNPATNTWWIAGTDTHYKVMGEPGKSPYLDGDGYWWAYDDTIREYVHTGINARGEDGRCPMIGSNGNWLHWNQREQVWEDSGVQALGEDGIDGTAVRRIIVPSTDDIPQEGDTCNGGVYYYVPVPDALPVAIIDVLDAAAGGFTVNGIPIGYTGQASREAAAVAVAEALETALDTLPDLSVETDGSRVVMTADIPGWTFEALDTERYTLEEHVRMKAQERYNVHAWLEQPDGTGGWVCVGEASDIATAEIYGLVKTATDTVVRNGAPVGNNEKGQMSVPLAAQDTSGSVRISFPDTMEEGGRIGFDMDKRLRVELASLVVSGAVRLSYSGDYMTTGGAEGTIGLRPDGSIGVRWATHDSPGVSRLGSEFGQLNRIPYQQGVGATADHQLANNFLFRGALKHQKLNGWKNLCRMAWLDELDGTIQAEERDFLNDHDYYTGLHTSLQFTQSEENGLVLLPASSGLLAGVYLALSMDDGRDDAVPAAKTVQSWGLASFYTKDETYTRNEIDGFLEGKASKQELQEHMAEVGDAISEHNRSVSGTLNTFDNYIKTQLFTKSEFNTAKEVFMTRTENWHGSVVMSENTYNALGTVDSKTMYFLTDEA